MPASPKRTHPPSSPLASGRMNKREAAVLAENAVQCESVLYDFSEDGGAVGDVDFGVKLPANSAVYKIIADVQTAATSGGLADYKLKAGSTDLMSATDFDDATDGIDGTGVIDISAVSPAKLTAASELKLEIVTAALTAGKVRFSVLFVESK